MKSKLIFCLLFALGSQIFAQQGWQYQNSGLTNNQYGAIWAFNQERVYVMADQGVFLKTLDGGTTWIEQNSGYPAAIFDVAFIDGDTGYAAGTNGLLIKTIDGGSNWFKMTSGTNGDLFSIFIRAADNIWVVGDSGVVLHSSDYGNSWIKNTGLTAARLNSICFHDANVGFIAGNNGTLLKTVNGGTNWNLMTISTTEDLFSLTTTSGYTYLMAGFVYGYMYMCDQVYRTSDNASWAGITFATPIPGNSKLFFQNDSLGFCISSDCTTNGDCGIFIGKTDDFGQNWTTSFENWDAPSMTGLAYTDIVFVTDSIGFALTGNNILKTTDGGTFVGVYELKHPQRVKLFPNPCPSGYLTLEVTGIDLDGVSVEISDISNRIVFATEILGNTTKIDMANFSQGMFLVKLFKDKRLIDVEELIK